VFAKFQHSPIPVGIVTKPLVARSQQVVLSLATHASPAQSIPVFPASKAPVNPAPVHTEARLGVLDVVILEHLALIGAAVQEQSDAKFPSQDQQYVPPPPSPQPGADEA